MSAVTAVRPPSFSASFPSAAPAVPARPPEASRPVHRFALLAEPHPGLLPRAIELVAKLGLVPQRVHAVLEGDGERAELAVDLRVEGLEDGQAEHVGECLAGLVGVTWSQTERLSG